MSFLNWPVEQAQLDRGARQRRRKVIDGLLDQFGRAFPQITYELGWSSATVNSQAWQLGTTRYVRVYGGLVRHPKMTRPGLALMLAHETGHHLGGPPYDPAMSWISWQGQADYWAAHVGMKKVFGADADRMTLRGARQIVELHRDFGGDADEDEPDLSAECRYRIFVAGAKGAPMPDCAPAALLALARHEPGG
jgi:hypothetical protein